MKSSWIEGPSTKRGTFCRVLLHSTEALIANAGP